MAAPPQSRRAHAAGLSRMIFTPRVLKGIYLMLRCTLRLEWVPGAPTEAAFIAHFAPPQTHTSLTWVDPDRGIAYLYDVTVNQVQLTPPHHPNLRGWERVNSDLWQMLPPHLLEEPSDWLAQWRAAAQGPDVRCLAFLLEQGFDPHPHMGPADWQHMWARAAKAPNLAALRFILDQNIAPSAVLSAEGWQHLWDTALAAENLPMLSFIEQYRVPIRRPADWTPWLAQAIGATKVEFLEFIFRHLDEPLLPPSAWAGLWQSARAGNNSRIMRLVLRFGLARLGIAMSPAEWQELWFHAADYHHLEMLQLILEQGFNVNTRNAHGSNALPFLMGPSGGSLPSVEFLVKAGLQIDAEKLEQYITTAASEVSAAGEASEASGIARYLRQTVAERTAIPPPP